MNLFLDFLFPKSNETLELEALSAAAILDKCPQAERISEKDIFAIFDYSHPTVKKIVWEIKYRGNKIIADKAAEIIHDVIKHEFAEISLFHSGWQETLIPLVPVPSSKERRRERGWNQTELITAKIMDKDMGHTFAHFPKQLIKIRHTQSQTETSSKNARLENIKNSMSIIDEQVFKGKNVLIIDDVFTTGATFAEARRVLKLAGAKQILCVAFAH
ncbi:MAG: ComF family protein [Candidatus Zambryskibacteria bacterium]|nr:ComF family protein [Candidatus Zambryskibacteria bacterium]